MLETSLSRLLSGMNPSIFNGPKCFPDHTSLTTEVLDPINPFHGQRTATVHFVTLFSRIKLLQSIQIGSEVIRINWNDFDCDTKVAFDLLRTCTPTSFRMMCVDLFSRKGYLTALSTCTNIRFYDVTCAFCQNSDMSPTTNSAPLVSFKKCCFKEARKYVVPFLRKSKPDTRYTGNFLWMQLSS